MEGMQELMKGNDRFTKEKEEREEKRKQKKRNSGGTSGRSGGRGRGWRGGGRGGGEMDEADDDTLTPLTRKTEKEEERDSDDSEEEEEEETEEEEEITQPVSPPTTKRTHRKTEQERDEEAASVQQHTYYANPLGTASDTGSVASELEMNDDDWEDEEDGADDATIRQPKKLPTLKPTRKYQIRALCKMAVDIFPEEELPKYAIVKEKYDELTIQLGISDPTLVNYAWDDRAGNVEAIKPGEFPEKKAGQMIYMSASRWMKASTNYQTKLKSIYIKVYIGTSVILEELIKRNDNWLQSMGHGIYELDLQEATTETVGYLLWSSEIEANWRTKGVLEQVTGCEVGIKDRAIQQEDKAAKKIYAVHIEVAGRNVEQAMKNLDKAYPPVQPGLTRPIGGSHLIFVHSLFHVRSEKGKISIGRAATAQGSFRANIITEKMEDFREIEEVIPGSTSSIRDLIMRIAATDEKKITCIKAVEINKANGQVTVTFFPKNAERARNLLRCPMRFLFHTSRSIRHGTQGKLFEAEFKKKFSNEGKKRYGDTEWSQKWGVVDKNDKVHDKFDLKLLNDYSGGEMVETAPTEDDASAFSSLGASTAGGTIDFYSFVTYANANAKERTTGQEAGGAERRMEVEDVIEQEKMEKKEVESEDEAEEREWTSKDEQEDIVNEQIDQLKASFAKLMIEEMRKLQDSTKQELRKMQEANKKENERQKNEADELKRQIGEMKQLNTRNEKPESQPMPHVSQEVEEEEGTGDQQDGHSEDLETMNVSDTEGMGGASS
jgi:hypothetical protein